MLAFGDSEVEEKLMLLKCGMAKELADCGHNVSGTVIEHDVEFVECDESKASGFVEDISSLDRGGVVDDVGRSEATAVVGRTEEMFVNEEFGIELSWSGRSNAGRCAFITPKVVNF